MNALTEIVVVTNAASTGIRIDRAQLKSLARRSDRPGLTYLALWALALALTGAPIWFALGTPYVWAAVFVFGVVMSVPSYALSHETAHGTAFRTRWLNETVFWFTSLLYGEEPLHRRYTHTNHHTYTWYVGLDSQMPFDTPLTFRAGSTTSAGCRFTGSSSGCSGSWRPSDTRRSCGRCRLRRSCRR